MKNLFITLSVCVFSTLSLIAQQPTLVFKYDASGNRYERTILVDKMIEVDSTDFTLDNSLQNGNLTAQKITVYPNPTEGFVNIDLSLMPEQDANYIIVGINGTLIEKGNITSTQTPINLTHFGKGTYILHVVSGSEKEKFKIVKQ